MSHIFYPPRCDTLETTETKILYALLQKVRNEKIIPGTTVCIPTVVAITYLLGFWLLCGCRSRALQHKTNPKEIGLHMLV